MPCPVSKGQQDRGERAATPPERAQSPGRHQELPPPRPAKSSAAESSRAVPRTAELGRDSRRSNRALAEPNRTLPSSYRAELRPESCRALHDSPARALPSLSWAALNLAKLGLLFRQRPFPAQVWAQPGGAVPGDRGTEMPLARSRLGLLLLGALFTLVLYLLLPAAQHQQRLAGIRPEEGKRGWRAANTTGRTGMARGKPPIFYREVSAGSPVSGTASPRSHRPDVLFLHGQAFTSKTWEALGTLALVAGEGYRAVAIDLPGYGDSPPAEMVATAQTRVAFLDHILQELDMRRPVLVSPSMSGRFALPFLLAQGDQLAGFVPIAPVGTKDYTAEQYQQVQTPTLILYGVHDTSLGSQVLQSLRHLPRHHVAVLPDAGHACYMDKPEDFHRALLGFLRQLK